MTTRETRFRATGTTAAAGLGARERGKQEKLARLTAAARRLFYEQGFDGATTQQIASLAGVATGTLFLYAPTKEDLLILVFVDEIGEVLDEALRSLPADGVAERLNHLFQRMLSYHTRDMDLSRRMMKSLVFVANDQTRGPAFAITETILRAIADLVADGQAGGAIRSDVDPAEAAGYLFAVYMNAAARLFSGMGDLGEVRGFLERGIRLQIEGLAPAGMTEILAQPGARAPAKIGYQMTKLKRRLRTDARGR